MKFLLALLPLLALCSAQNPLPLNATLDDGNFIIRWGLIGNTGWVEIEVQVHCTGWVSILLASADGSRADVHLGGYLADIDLGYLHVSSK